MSPPQILRRFAPQHDILEAYYCHGLSAASSCIRQTIVGKLFRRTPRRRARGDQALRISRRERTRSIKGRMPSSREMARDSSSRDMAFSRSPGLLRWSKASA